MVFCAPAWWWDGCQNDPPCPHHDMHHIDDPIPWCIVDGCSCGMPAFYEATDLALPPAPERRALPWGDSAYTSAIYHRDHDWWPRMTWAMGPLSDTGLTPSSEGPRRQAEAEGRQFARWLDQHETTIRRRRSWPLGIDPDAPWYIPTHSRGDGRG